MAKTKKRPSPKGRPSGAKTTRLEVEAKLTRCPICRSTDRGPYLSKMEQFFRGTDPAGNPYTHIVRRRCQCSKCGQMRIDRAYENRNSRN